MKGALLPGLVGARSAVLGVVVLVASDPVGTLVPREIAVQTAVVAGQILSDQGQPIGAALVTLTGIDSSFESRVNTAESGRFAFEGVRTGRYRLAASRPGYAPRAYGQTASGELGSPIAVKGDEAVSDIVVKLPRLATLSGTVRRTDGSILAGVTLTVLEVGTGSFGTRVLKTVGTGASDEIGAFQIQNVAPGHYLLRATPPLAGFEEAVDVSHPPQLSASDSSGKSDRPKRLGYPPTWFPHEPDSDTSVPIALASGANRTGVDVLLLDAVGLVEIRGRVFGVDGGLAAAAELSLSGMEGSQIDPRSRRVQVQQGEFYLPDLAPGDYLLQARDPRTGQQGYAEVPFHVSSGTSVSTLDMYLAPTGNVRGKVTSKLDAATRPSGRVTLHQVPSTGAPRAIMSSPISSDGSFAFNGVPAGRFIVRTRLTSGSWTQVSTRTGGGDVEVGGFELASGQTLDDLVIALVDPSGSVSGHVLDSAGRPATEVTLVLFPVNRGLWSRADRTLVARPDNRGEFVIPRVVGGEYRLGALLHPRENEYLQPKILEALVDQSVPARVTESTTTVVDLTIGTGKGPGRR